MGATRAPGTPRSRLDPGASTAGPAVRSCTQWTRPASASTPDPASLLLRAIVNRAAFGPFEGAEDLNDPAALQLDGVLFMEGEGEASEMNRLKRDVRATADDS